jgi:hypothetical protein
MELNIIYSLAQQNITLIDAQYFAALIQLVFAQGTFAFKVTCKKKISDRM